MTIGRKFVNELFSKIDITCRDDRMRTCYMQAYRAYVNFKGISNADIRKIFA